jgi:hypothetical protein
MSLGARRLHSVNSESFRSSQRRPTIGRHTFHCGGVGRGGVGRDLGMGVVRGVGVGRGVTVGVGLGVTVGVGAGVGVGAPPPAGAWIATVIGDPVLKSRPWHL